LSLNSLNGKVEFKIQFLSCLVSDKWTTITLLLWYRFVFFFNLFASSILQARILLTIMAGWNESQLRKYNIRMEKIPTLQYDDPKVDSLLTNNVRNQV